MQTQALERPSTSVSQFADRHSLGLSVGLHLIPGLLAGVMYYLLAPLVARAGLPSIAALMAAGVLVIIPFELGVIAWAARKQYPRPARFMEMIHYREPLPFWRYLVLVPVIIIFTGLLFTLASPVTGFLQGLFGWLPESMLLNIGMEGNYSRSTLVWITVLNGLLIAFAIPVVEELYFRGFLLPRMPESLKGWTPLAHSFLFAVYHLWTPWMFFARTLGLLPLIYVVQRSRNLYLGMIAHCLVNLIDVITVIVFITQMS